MKTFKVIKNQQFIGRWHEKKKLKELSETDSSLIIIIYGRRRVGKTELLEQSFADRNILKFEGLEGKSQPLQRQHVMQQLAYYAEEPSLKQIEVINWVDVFTHINNYVSKGKWTLYFEELQWLANYEDDFIAELKYAWDNFFRRNQQLIVILCGSSPSFMINHVVHSRSLYNRSQHEIYLKELNIIDTKHLLGNYPERDLMDIYLTVGGIPEYLQRLEQQSSLFSSLCEAAFSSEGFFTQEYQRIFVSSLAKNKFYQKIILFLSKRRFATREDIAKHLQTTAGGTLTTLLLDLELSGFISRYAPYYLEAESKLVRYCIEDAYLQFYFKFIKNKATEIKQGRFNDQPQLAINRETYSKWLGFSFERFCRRHAHVIAKILGFSALNYRSGAYFSRATNETEANYQVDLVFDRPDNVFTICEIKYLRSKLTKTVVQEFENKLALLKLPKQKLIHKVLITVNDDDKSDLMRRYFDAIITLSDLFDTHYW